MFARLATVICLVVLSWPHDASAASTLNVKLKDDNTLAVSLASQTLNLKAAKPWTTEQQGNDTYYVVNADIVIGKLNLFNAEAKVGKAGGSFKVSVAPKFSDLSISAGSFEFSLLPGDVIEDAPANAEFSKSEMVMVASVSNAVTLSVGDNASFSVPGTGNVDVTMMIEFNKGTFYYEGPLPAVQELVGGVDQFIKASKEGETTSAGFGYSSTRAFKFTSSMPLYTGKSKQETESFSCNVVLNGSFDLAEAVAMNTELCINTDSGKVGSNGALTLSTEVLKLDAEFTVGEGSVAIDKSGVRFGFGKTTPDLNKKLENVLHFVAPMLTADASIYGYATNKKKFGVILDSDSLLDINAVKFKDLHLGLTSSGLDVSATLKSKNLGSVKVAGEVTDSKCWLDIDGKSSIFGYQLDAPRVKPCQAAEGAVEYAGKIAILGKNLAVKGVDKVNKKGKASIKAAEDLVFKVGSLSLNAGKLGFDELKTNLKLGGSKLAAVSNLGDFDFGDMTLNTSGWPNTEMKTSKSYKYGKKLGLSGGSVRVSGDGTVEASLLVKNGSLEVGGHLNTTSKAKFCVKVKFAGHKTSKCDSIKVSLDEGLDLSGGCFRVSGSKKILGQNFSIPSQDICLGKDSDGDDSFRPDGDSVGVVVHLQSYVEKFVMVKDGGNNNDVYATNDQPEGYATFIMYHQVQGDEDTKEDTCPTYGSNVSFLVYNDKRQNRYLRLDRKENPVDSKADKARSNEQFILESVEGKKSGSCITQGDKIRIRSNKFGTYWTVQRGEGFRLYGVNKASGDSAAHQEFTIYMDSDS
ncbi:hypothetical protein JCM17960_10040 [Magnetospira thiophila]